MAWMGLFMHTISLYVQRVPPLGTHYKFLRKDVEALITQARSIVRDALRNPPPNAPSAIAHGMWMSQLTDIWLIHALDRYGVEKKDIVRVYPFLPF